MPDTSDAITALGALGPLRVWSVLVTVFGDLAPDKPLDGPTVSALVEGLGIKPEATRVALHRLRADGWIISEKKGRISRHSLTAKGRQDSEAARPRIYARPSTENNTPKVVLMPDVESDLNPADFAAITPRLFLCAPDTSIPASAMILSAKDVPNWIGPQIEPTSLLKGYQALFDVLRRIEADLTDQVTPLETAMLRVMIVHAWRRLVLKHPVLPRSAHSADWREYECRALVTALLDRLERPAPDEIVAP